MFRSLRFRIAASHALVLAVMLIALGALVQLLLARSLDRGATGDLLQQASAQVVRIDEAGHPVPPTDTDVPSAQAVQTAVYAAPGGTLVGEPTEIPSWLQLHQGPVTDLVVGHEQVRIVTLPAVIDGRTVAWVVAGRSLVAEQRLLHRVRLSLLLGGVAAVLGSLVAGWWLAGKAVRPVERAYEAQAGFAADASHEFRSPLTFIRSGVETLVERDPELGEEILGEVDYLTDLTGRLLLLARTDADGAPLDLAPLDVAEVCRSAAHRSEIVHGNRLTLTGETALIVPGDRVSLEAALDAVLENVAKHGGGLAALSWCREGPDVVVTVADHGPGVPTELLDKAFDRFFRVDPSRARQTGGAGLGLALSRTLVQAQGGFMALEPTPGGGLTARIGLSGT